MTRLSDEVNSEDRGRLFIRAAELTEARAKARSEMEEEGLCSKRQTPTTLRGFFFKAVQE